MDKTEVAMVRYKMQLRRIVDHLIFGPNTITEEHIALLLKATAEVILEGLTTVCENDKPFDPKIASRVDESLRAFESEAVTRNLELYTRYSFGYEDNVLAVFDKQAQVFTALWTLGQLVLAPEQLFISSFETENNTLIPTIVVTNDCRRWCAVTGQSLVTEDRITRVP